jgi:hypothetical protein
VLAQYNAGTCPPPQNPLVRHALQAAAQWSGAPLELLHALAFVASGYDPHARSGFRCGLVGLAPDRSFDPFNPVVAAECAAMFLVAARKQFRGSWAHALAAFYWDPPNGPQRVAARGDFHSWPADVQAFVGRVLSAAGIALPFEVPTLVVVPR